MDPMGYHYSNIPLTSKNSFGAANERMDQTDGAWFSFPSRVSSDSAYASRVEASIFSTTQKTNACEWRYILYWDYYKIL